MENRETITINIQLNTDKDGNQTSAMSLSKCCRTKVYNTPIIYGNESIYNEIKKHLIYSGQQNKQLLYEIERLKIELKDKESVNENLSKQVEDLKQAYILSCEVLEKFKNK